MVQPIAVVVEADGLLRSAQFGEKKVERPIGVWGFGGQARGGQSRGSNDHPLAAKKTATKSLGQLSVERETSLQNSRHGGDVQDHDTISLKMGKMDVVRSRELAPQPWK
jgi:hypothetical protein